jgi:Ca2+-binding RTX toxin-like protein
VPEQLNLSAKALTFAGALGAAIALVVAFALPEAGFGGGTTTTTTVKPVTCDGQPADVVMAEPGTYVATGQPEVIVGSSGDDSIRGTKGGDLICGRRGDDHLNGGMGGDELRGQDGEDLLRGRRGSDDLIGGFDEDANARGSESGEQDRCFGGDPTSDIGPKGDTASQCEAVKSARIIDIEKS